MLTRKQARAQKVKKEVGGSSNGNGIGKRAAENSPAMQQPQKKRNALGDITNKFQDLRNVRIDSSKKQGLAKPTGVVAPLSLLEPKPEGNETVSVTVSTSVTVSISAENGNASGSSSSATDVSMLSTIEESTTSSEASAQLSLSEVKDEVQSLMVFPPGFGIRTDYDRENEFDSYNIPHYAQDIFDYYKAREACFTVRDYMEMQQASGGITRQMRAILIDWMVEVQESFELNHETLYQAVKMTDLYLEKAVVDKETLQLIGATALFISSKFDERQPPLIDDFLYICDDAYTRKQILDMEEVLLKVLKFDIGYPLSYRFLRRYAKATKADMTSLTLARYILEMSLMHYEFVHLPESLVAAAAYYLALRIKNSEWTDVHVQYSGYTAAELHQLMWDLNAVIKGSQLTKNLSNIRAKYSHDVFYGVAKLPPLPGPLVSPTMS